MLTDIQKRKLMSISNVLNTIEVKGRNNAAALIACMNEIDTLLREDTKGADDSGNVNAES